MALWMKFFHVAMVLWFVGGLIGRTLVMWQASKATEVRLTQMLVYVAGFFERWMVIPGSLAVFGFGLATAWMQHWPVLGVLEGASTNWLFVSTILTLSMVPIIAFVFVPRGKIFEKALEQAAEIGQVTPQLHAAFHDRIVGMAHVYEIIMTVVVLFLMVMKPF